MKAIKIQCMKYKCLHKPSLEVTFKYMTKGGVISLTDLLKFCITNASFSVKQWLYIHVTEDIDWQ